MKAQRRIRRSRIFCLFWRQGAVWTGTMAVGMSVLLAATGPQSPKPPPSSTPSGSSQKAASSEQKPEFPPPQKVLQGYTEVITTIDRQRPLMSLWVRKKDNQVLAAFPPGFEKKKWFIALTISSGERYAGLQAGEYYGYWRRIGKRMAFVVRNLAYRSTGDPESKASVRRLFTDKVLVDVPIVTILPKWGPVIDLDQLLVGQAEAFFGRTKIAKAKKHLATIRVAKAFPHNIEIAFEMPMADGVLKSFYYSISEILPNPSYKPRLADQRIGYFTTTFVDLGKYQGDDNKVRYINRWDLQKADPSLKISPVKKPIVFYIEYTTPIRYRRWVREGVLRWNKAFERIGLANAIEVYYQDATTGAHMEKDPEDVRYNFIRWLNNDMGTAIGPSRVNPETGEILDADVIITDGWIRYFWRRYHNLLPRLAMEGMSPETLAWLQKYPQFDPRVLLAPPEEREAMMEKIRMAGVQPYGGLGLEKDEWMERPVGGTCTGPLSLCNARCDYAEFLSLDMGLAALHWDMIADLPEDPSPSRPGKTGTGKRPKKESVSLLDGIPEWFVGPLVADLVCHEVGHTLGLRHNFKASSIYTLKQINSPEFKGKKPFAGSVMDYIPINIYRLKPGEFQGDYCMIDIGPYDYWAIEYGYTPTDDPKVLQKILSRAAEPELAFATDEDTVGPDPLARRYDFSANPIDYARRQMALVHYHRKRLINRFVRKGQSWARARYGYELTLGLQTRALTMMANWLGGSFRYRDKKGDPNGRPPFEVVPPKKQREALEFVIQNCFRDEAFDLSPELLRHFGIDKWLDEPKQAMQDGRYPVHDRIMGIQASLLTALLNPTILGRVLDNEMMTPPDQDAVTLPEVFGRLWQGIWTEIIEPPPGKFTARKPMISSLRRNLQREYVERMIYLSMPESWSSAAHKPVATLALAELRKIHRRVGEVLSERGDCLDPYTHAHLQEIQVRIESALKLHYTYPMRKGGS